MGCTEEEAEAAEEEEAADRFGAGWGVRQDSRAAPVLVWRYRLWPLQRTNPTCSFPHTISSQTTEPRRQIKNTFHTYNSCSQWKQPEISDLAATFLRLGAV